MKQLLLLSALFLMLAGCEKIQGQEPASTIETFRGETVILDENGNVLMKIIRPSIPPRRFFIRVDKKSIMWTSDSTFILAPKP